MTAGNAPFWMSATFLAISRMIWRRQRSASFRSSHCDARYGRRLYQPVIVVSTVERKDDGRASEKDSESALTS